MSRTSSKRLMETCVSVSVSACLPACLPAGYFSQAHEQLVDCPDFREENFARTGELLVVRTENTVERIAMPISRSQS